VISPLHMHILCFHVVTRLLSLSPVSDLDASDTDRGCCFTSYSSSCSKLLHYTHWIKSRQPLTHLEESFVHLEVTCVRLRSLGHTLEAQSRLYTKKLSVSPKASSRIVFSKAIAEGLVNLQVRQASASFTKHYPFTKHY
jgi:hypothetical protein